MTSPFIEKKRVQHLRVSKNNGQTDDVNSPSHYTVGGFEAIDVIRAKLTPEEYRGYLKGAMLKYLMRANYKDQHDKDCLKAQWYANELARFIDGSGTPAENGS